jgi:hypothetical protein
MTDVNLPPRARPLIDRVRGILLTPRDEWAKIAVEPATLQGLFTGYVCILAAIPAIAMVVGLTIFGAWGWRFPIGSSIGVGVGSYIASMLATAALGFGLEFLGPQFGARPGRVAAFKLAAYCLTPFWVAGVLYILPSLGALAGLAGLYGAYLIYLGLPVLAPAEPDKAQTWTIVAIVGAILAVAIAAGAGQTSGLFGGYYADNAPARGTLTVPGYGSVDLARAEAAQKAADAAIARALAENAAPPAQAVPAADLTALLPETITGFSRSAVSSTAGGMGGVTGSTAKGTYTRGDGRIELSITDMGGAAAFAQLGSAFNVSHSEEGAGRYERVGQVDGRMTSEKYDEGERTGQYSVVVAERFLVEASGSHVDMAALKAAVTAVGPARLEAMARPAR